MRDKGRENKMGVGELGGAGLEWANDLIFLHNKLTLRIKRVWFLCEKIKS